MQISLIIPAWNEAALIETAVARAWACRPLEVLVADGGSDDATAELAERAGATVLRTPRGRAIQQNAAARSARGDVLLFLHADTWLAAEGVPQIELALQDAAIISGAFRQRIEADGRRYRLLERGNAWRLRARGLPYGDQGLFLRREAFERAGGFPEVRLMEDWLLMRRLRHSAWPVLLPGPLHVSPRRWERHGVVRQTLRNWTLVAAATVGVAPDRLARFYAPHAAVPRKSRTECLPAERHA